MRPILVEGDRIAGNEPNLLTNPGFEQWSPRARPANLLTGWSPVRGRPSSAKKLMSRRANMQFG